MKTCKVSVKDLFILGPKPAGPANERFQDAEIAQSGERQTEDLKVPGSNPESSPA